MGWIRTAKYGSRKISDTALHTIRGNVIEILEDATFTTINEAGITSPITVHNVAGVQPAGEFVYAKTKFTGLQLSAGVVRIGGYRRKRILGLSAAIKAAAVLWLFAKPTRDTYILGKNGVQDREALSGEIFPGRGYDGDGTNYVTLDTPVAFADDLSWAISCFVDWDVIAVVDYIAGNTFTGGAVDRIMKLVSGTEYAFEAYDGTQVAWTVTIPTVRHHFLIQCDGSNSDNLELFLDGVSQGTKTMADTKLTIANFMDREAGGLPGEGIYEDFRIYGRTLDPTEIAALQTKDALGGELVWYPCEDVVTATAYDASGNENHGTKVSWDAANHVEGPWQSLMNKYGYNQDVTYEEVPPDMSDTTKDCLGNALVYKGQAHYHGISVDAACFVGDGVAYFTITGLLTTDTIEVESGSDTPTCTSDNRLDIADSDEVYGVTIKRASVVWAIIPFCEGVGITVYDVSGNDNHGTGTSVDETNWGTQDDFHYIRDYGMSKKIMDVGKGSFDVGTENWVALGTNIIENDAGALKITYVDNAGGANNYLRETKDLNTNLIVGEVYRLKIKIKVNSGSSVNLKVYRSGDDPFVMINETDYVWKEIIFVADHATANFLQFTVFGTDEIIWIDEWYIELVDGFIPALADESADVTGNVLQYPHGGIKAIPDTYFKLPENIGELTAADLETRYLDIMDPGKGTFDSGVESWNIWGTNTLENDNGALKGVYVDNANGVWVSLSDSNGDLTTNLTVGISYCVKIKAKCSSGATFKLRFYDGASVWAETDNITTEYVWYEFTFTAAHATNARVQQKDMGAGEIVWIDEYYVLEVQTQTGNNLITDGEGKKWADDNSDGIGNGWVHYTGAGTPTIVAGNGFVGNAQKIDHVNGTITTFRYPTGINAVSGQTYRVTFKYRADITGFKVILRYSSDYFTSTIPANTDDATEISYDIEATGATEIILTFRADTAAANQYLEVDEIELCPVIDSVFYEPAVLGLAPVVINVSDIPAVRYLTQYYDITNRKNLIMLEADHGFGDDEHKRLLKFTKNT